MGQKMTNRPSGAPPSGFMLTLDMKPHPRPACQFQIAAGRISSPVPGLASGCSSFKMVPIMTGY